MEDFLLDCRARNLSRKTITDGYGYPLRRRLLPVYSLIGEDTGQTSEASLFRMAQGIDFDRIHERRTLLQEFDRVRSSIDHSGAMEAMDRHGQQAVEMLVGRRAQDAFDITRERARLNSNELPPSCAE